VLSLLAMGVFASLALGLWRLRHGEALAAFYLYEAALGLADLVTLGLRGRRRLKVSALLATLLWLAGLVATSLSDTYVWPLVTVVASAFLVAVHRPDMGLFAASTLPASLALLFLALRRGEPSWWGYLVVLLLMAGLFEWRRRGERTRRADHTEGCAPNDATPHA